MATPQYNPNGSDLQQVTVLMRRMGAKSFDPMPPTQHQWQRGKAWPEVMRLWSWLCYHTIHWGHRSEYAVDHEGNELHIENAAAALKMDEANARRAWRAGVGMGIWRNGTKNEGMRRLYLVGQVDLSRAEREGEEKAAEVCTDLLPPYILLQINKLAPERRAEFEQEYLALDKAGRGAVAEAVAAVRDIIDQQKDSMFSAFGIHKIHAEKNSHLKAKARAGRNGHHAPMDAPGKPAEGMAAAQDAAANVRPIAEACRQAVLPLMDWYVQTFRESVQSGQSDPYKAPEEARTGPPTLLQQKLPEKSQNIAASGRVWTDPRPLQNPALKKESPPQVATQGQKSEPLDDEEKKALELLFTKTREMQNKFPHTQFGDDLVNPENKGDQAWARRVLAAIGGAGEMEAFLYQLNIDFGLADRNSLGKLPRPRFEPAKNKHERFIGLIVERAGDWLRNAPERARQLAEDEAASARRKERRHAQWLETQADLEKIVADPTATEQDKVWAAQILAEGEL